MSTTKRDKRQARRQAAQRQAAQERSWEAFLADFTNETEEV